MPRLMRSKSDRIEEADDDEQDVMDDNDILSSTRKRFTNTQIDKKFAYKFMVASDNESTVLQSLLVRLLHPKSSTPMLYQLSADNQSIAEVLRIDESHRSWFIGDAVVADGSLLILAPIHPMFLILPYLIKNASHCFAPIDDWLLDENYPHIARLSNNCQLQKALLLCTETRRLLIELYLYKYILEMIDQVVMYRYCEQKTLGWLEKRYEMLKTALLKHGNLHEAIINDDEVQCRYAFTMLCDYIPSSLAILLKVHLSIKDIVQQPSIVDVNKRKVEDYELEETNKTPDLTLTQKRLKQASKGTVSLMGFFNKKQ